MTLSTPPSLTPDIALLAQTSGLLESLIPYTGVLVVAFVVSLIMTPWMRHLAVKHGVVDWPDLKRKNHARPVAYLGGVAIFFGWLAGSFASYLITPDSIVYGSDVLRGVHLPISILIGAAVITITGLYDDVTGIRARVKVGGQLFAAAALTWDRVGIDLTDTLFSLVGVMPSESIVYFTATFLVAMFVLGGCNAVNLIDGLDGLSSGVVAIAMAGFIAIALLIDQHPDAVGTVATLDTPKRLVLCLAAIGAILGFLPYNFNPASIFMGDAGSLLLGFLSVAAILMFGDAGGWSLKLVTAALIVFAVPITDTSLAIIRRKMRGQPIFAPDSQHLHHLLRKSGLSVKKSVFVMYGAAILFAAVGVSMVAFDLRWRTSLTIFFVIYGVIMITAFRYGAYCLALDHQRQAELENSIPDDAPINHADQPSRVAAAVEMDTSVDAPQRN